MVRLVTSREMQFTVAFALGTTFIGLLAKQGQQVAASVEATIAAAPTLTPEPTKTLRSTPTINPTRVIISREFSGGTNARITIASK